jgi:endonuclease/exonuclease/phosphatase (EEP) superfamily protein YafD
MTFAVLRRRLRLIALLLLYASVAAIAAGTLLAELGQEWWIADLFAHFRYHYSLGAVLLAAAALALGRRGAGLAAVCLIVPQIWAVAAPPRTPTAPEAAAQARVRVMSINVLWSNQRFDDVVRAVERERPDILSLQEVTLDWHRTVERLAARLPHAAPANWRTELSDNIVLSRYPITESRVVVPPNQHRPFAHVEATVNVNGRLVRVLAVHPPLPASARNTATRQANFDYYARLAAGTDLPLLIVGDLNITPYSPRFRALLREGGLRYVHLGWNWPSSWPSESRGNYQRYIRGFPIDHVLTSRHFAALSGRALEDVGSDHYPVVADLVMLK